MVTACLRVSRGERDQVDDTFRRVFRRVGSDLLREEREYRFNHRLLPQNAKIQRLAAPTQLCLRAVAWRRMTAATLR
jgi:hypothetical protein